MLDLALPPEYEALRLRMRAFVDELLIPIEHDSTSGTDLKPELRAQLEAEAKKRGLWMLHVPKEFGGQAGDMFSKIVIWQELGRSIAIPPRRWAVFGPDPGPILYQLSEEQREKYLWPVLRGEKKCAFAQTEAGAGADPAGMSTTAVRDGDHYVINGRKRFIGFGDEADFLQVVALTDPAKRARGGISTFLVDADTPGFRVVRQLETMMIDRPVELEFVNVRVPAKNLIGQEGDGFRLAQSWITEGRLARHGARGAGVIERCLEMGVKWAGERTTVGVKLADRQSIQFMLVDMYQHLYQLRLMLYDTGGRFDAGEDVRTESYMCKYVGDESAFNAADRCMQMHGAIGLTNDFPIETFWKQARSFVITEGPTEVLKMVVARSVFKEFAPPAPAAGPMKMLDGIKVLELGSTLTAPFAAMLLADLGADVVKIENPEGGDNFRSFRGALYSPQFIAYNKNKRSATLDLRSDAGKAMLWELIDNADVLLENFRHGVLDRLGFSWDALHARNPRLIYCSITGFGSTGPYRDRPAYDTVATALTGVLGLFLDRDDPRISGPTMADNAGGVFACYGILGALFERTRSNVGRRVEVNMLEAVMSFVPDSFSTLTATGVVTTRDTRVSASQSYALKCADGKLVAIHLSSPEKFWTGLVAALDAPELATDPRFDKRMGRIDNFTALREALKAIAITQPRAYWVARFEANDVPYAPINGVDEAMADPQIQALGTFYSVMHPSEGEVVNIRRPVLIDGQRTVAELAPPVLGEHTAEILDPNGDWRRKRV